MTQGRRGITVVGLAGALFACAQRADPPRDDTPGNVQPADSIAAPPVGRFVGVLPCADCAGIRIDLRLYAEQPSGKPARYEATETYLATRDGDRTFTRTGRWTIMRGTGTDRDATVYQLDSDSADARRNFLRVSDAELRLLDRDQREITSAAPHSLYRVPNDQPVDPATLAEADSSRVAEVARGQTVIVRLNSNRSTGYRWTLVTSAAGALTTLGEPTYTPTSAPGGAVGGGGVEAWSFLASQSGRQTLRFEYRRPWESGGAAARVLTFAIVVR